MELKEELIYEFKYKSLFSEYLPQSFSITPMNGFDIFSIQLKENTDSIEPYSFSMSNFSINNKRRILYLPEITSYITLINYMLENRIINELCEISNESHHSYSKIIQMVDGEEAFIEHDGNYGEPPSYEVYQTEEDTLNGTVDDDPSNYTENIIEKLIRAKGAKGILSLDISNCYKSIYTHYLACIKIGLSEAKNQYMLAKKDKTLINDDYKKYKQLDTLIRKLNSNESNGVLTGPRVSNYIVEAYLSCIDKDILLSLNSNNKVKSKDFVRYADDYEFFIYEDKDVDIIISIVENVFNNYRLTLNDSKTQLQSFPYYIVRNLKHLYDKHTSEEVLSSNETIEMFNDFFEMEKHGTKGAIRYLIKSIDDRIIFENNKLYTTYLFNVLVNDSRSFVKVCRLIIQDKDKLDIDDSHFKIIENLLKQSIDMKKELECVWLIYLLKKLGNYDLSDEIKDEIIHSGNELALIVLISEYNITEDHKNIIVENATSWILLYQLLLNDIINIDQFKEKSLIKNNIPFYRRIKTKGFSFYRVEENEGLTVPVT